MSAERESDLCADCGHKRVSHRAIYGDSPDYKPCHVLRPEFCKCDGFKELSATRSGREDGSNG